MTNSAQLFALAATIPSCLLIIAMVRRGQLRVKYAMFWIPIGVAMIVFSAFPSLLNELAELFGVSYPPTVVFVLGLASLIFIAIHHSWELSRLDERVRLIAEDIALDRVDRH